MVIILEPNLTDEQIMELYQHYGDDKMAREDQLRRHPLFNEWKALAHIMKNEIYTQLKQSHRRES